MIFKTLQNRVNPLLYQKIIAGQRLEPWLGE
jgi:hypothetical protein